MHSNGVEQPLKISYDILAIESHGSHIFTVSYTYTSGPMKKYHRQLIKLFVFYTDMLRFWPLSQNTV